MWPPASPYVAMPPPGQQSPPLPPGQGGGYGGGGVMGASPDSGQHNYVSQGGYDQQPSAYTQQHMYHQQGDYMHAHHPSGQAGPPSSATPHTPYGDAHTPHGGYMAHQQQTPMYSQQAGTDYSQASQHAHQMNYGHPHHHQQTGPSSYPPQQTPPGGGVYHSGTPVGYAQQQYGTGGSAGGGQMGYVHTPGSGGGVYGDGGGYYTSQQQRTAYGGGGAAAPPPTTAGTPGGVGAGGAYDQSAGGAYGGMMPPAPPPPPMRPADPELVKRIHTIAEYCCRNPEMEELIRQRDGGDPRFAFINGGEGYDYFRYAVSCLQQGIELPLPPPPSIDSLQPNIDMIDGSSPGGQGGGGGAGRNGESNQMTPSPEAATGEGGGPEDELTREFDIDSLVMQYQEPPEPGTLGEALDKELDDVLQSVENQATSTAIRNGRHWIEVNGGNSVDSANLLAFAIRSKQSTRAVSFLHKLNILYLVHDVVQNEFVHKKGSSLVAAFKPYLVWMLRDAYQAAIKEQDAAEKVKKILSLWVKRGIIDEDEQEEMSFLMTSPVVDLERRGGGPHAPDSDKTGGDMNFTPGRGGEYGGLGSGGFGRADGDLSGFAVPNHARHPAGGLKGSPYSFHDASGMIAPPPPPGSRGGGGATAGSIGGIYRGAGGFDRRPDDLEYTPESIPVGMMATMLRSMSKRVGGAKHLLLLSHFLSLSLVLSLLVSPKASVSLASSFSLKKRHLCISLAA
ncbi:zinc knuckle domain-containing protein [Cystoisospora suis]|uniref:Zinc knuckle domain-containing protein n=1 Tax=Cystoisospora suis TaxID=483139 RepID=A0A2C6L8E2_9APIC|nr:zinc knuckle domain-containing protein [Cystoisospora suis]